MSCAHRCNQGRDCTCAIVAFYEQTEGAFPMPTGCSLKAPVDPERVPLPVIPTPRTAGLLVGVAAVGITLLAYLAARVIVLFAPG